MTDRRSFLKNTVFTSAGLLVLPVLSFAERKFGDEASGDIEKGFLHPPASARPQAFWMWMNGHITKKGLTLDLEAMKEMGLAGAFIFNTNIGLPKGPVAYRSAEWNQLFLHAVKEAKRLGLELFFHNSPGFSSTGGAKVTPQMGMQQLVWSEVVVKGSEVNIELPQPLTKLGYYKDAMVVAYPSLPAEKSLMPDKLVRITANDEEKDKSFLANSTNSFLLLEPNSEGRAILQLEFDAPFEARAIAITRLPELSQSIYDAAYDHPPTFALESSDDGQQFQTICTIRMPQLRFVDAPGVESFPAVKATFFRLVTHQRTRLTSIDLQSGPRLTNWPGKLNFTETDLHTTEQNVEDNLLIDPNEVIDITNNLQADGRLLWTASANGSWTILRIGHTCTGTKTVASPDDAGGLEIDKFSKEAVAVYFDLYLNSLIKQVKQYIPQTLKGILIDSYEVGKQNWTASFSTEFAKRHGYNIAAFAPALTGRIVKSVDDTEKFLWDFRRTQADLVAENYYGAFHEKCASYGLQLFAQPNGDGVFDSLQVGQYLNQSLSEFWVRYVPGTLNVCKQAVSIAHGYGKKTVAAEAYTGMPQTSRWTEYPYALKSQGDYIFSLGINRFVLHLFVHQPYTTGFPGMTMGPYGTHFDRNNTWRKAAGEWIRYLTRTQYLLQQGLPIADVLYFKGEDPTSGIPDVNYVDPPVPKTIAGDVIGPDVLMNRISIVNNRIVLPDGMQYRLLILAPLQRISSQILQKIKTLVEQGMRLIVTTKPMGTKGLEGSSDVQKIANELWGDLNGKNVTERSFGKGKIYWNRGLDNILKEHNIVPDFEFTSQNSDAAIHFTHRRAGDTEVYFVSNHLRRQQSLVCLFRVTGKQPEIWNAQTGEIYNAALFSFESERTYMPLQLEPADSLFVVFRKKAATSSYHTVLHNNAVLLTTQSFPTANRRPHQVTSNNFTIILWIKPDVPAEHPKGILIFPPEGDVVYGKGHVACGLAAGQNGVRVFEREKGPNHSASIVINCNQPLEGWTHIALRYKEGKPSLFINGRLVGSADDSGKRVHPGLDTAPTDEFFSAAFEGNSTKPELKNETLADDAIYELYQKGLPPPELPFPITAWQTSEGKLKAKIWQNGHYQLIGNDVTKSFDVTGCKIIPIESSWQVHFPPLSGAPSFIRLDKLMSLHKHSHFGVKHFSGTAIYQTRFLFPEKKGLDNQCIMLHLGRVEVVAAVELNGKFLGTFWKEPFQLDVTKAVVHGQNKLTVRVTNLWPNRLIGDAYLPEEADYDDNGFIKDFPDWYLQDKPKPGKRISFSAWNNFKKTDPLLESGLLGPVQLFVGLEKEMV